MTTILKLVLAAATIGLWTSLPGLQVLGADLAAAATIGLWTLPAGLQDLGAGSAAEALSLSSPAPQTYSLI